MWSLLARLPNLRNLCLGMWMGALSMHRQRLTCTGNALVSVMVARGESQPLLRELEQVGTMMNFQALKVIVHFT